MHTSRSITHHASIASAGPPVLPFLAPRAFEHCSPRRRLPGWMNNDAERKDLAGNIQRPESSRTRAWNDHKLEVANLANSCSRVSGGNPSPLLRPQTSHGDAGGKSYTRRPSSRTITTSGSAHAPSRRRLSPQYSQIWAYFHSQACRTYSTITEASVPTTEAESITNESSERTSQRSKRLKGNSSIQNSYFRSVHRAAYILNHSRTSDKEEVELVKELPSLDSLPEQDSAWIKKFALLNAVYDSRLPDSLRVERLQVEPGTEDSVKHLLDHAPDAEAIKTAWSTQFSDWFPDEETRNLWCDMMLWLLHNEPSKVIPVVKATGEGDHAPDYVVADILEHLASYYLQKKFKYKESLPQDLLHTLITLLESKPHLYSALSQKFVHLTLVHCTLEQGVELFNELTSRGFHYTVFTLCHFAYFFGKFGDDKRASSVLERILERGWSPNHKIFLECCTEILRNSAIKTGEYHTSADTVSKFVQMGVKLNVTLYTVVIHNAVDAGDMQMALRIFKLLQDNGFKPNDYTYTILTKGLKRSDDDDALRAIMRAGEQALPDLERPWYVATEILHCVYLKHFKSLHNNHAYYDLAQTYCQYFDAAPLIKVGVPVAYFRGRKESGQMQMKPSVPTMGIMLIAYLELVARKHPEEAIGLYRNFDQLVRIDDPDLSGLAKHSYIYNAFLLAFGRNSSTLSLIPDVLREMTDKRIHGLSLTTKQTWDILINSFMRHNQSAAAQRVLEIMQSHGQEPNDVTWNSLVKGYCRLQDVDRVVETIREMQLRKVEMDRFTVWALGKLRARDRLMAGLKTEKRQQQQRPAEDDYLVEEDYMEPEPARESLNEVPQRPAEADYLVEDDYMESNPATQSVDEAAQRVREEVGKDHFEREERKPAKESADHEMRRIRQEVEETWTDDGSVTGQMQGAYPSEASVKRSS